MPENYKKFVELGRVCLIRGGPDKGKLCTIVDVIDSQRALVSGPASLTGVTRQQLTFRNLVLTDLKVDSGLNAKDKVLAAKWEEAEIQSKWEKSGWAKKYEQAKLVMSDKLPVITAG